ncbi:hypothetical protein KDA08_03785 [Candidatus Saccharibacteria bacterium]|nr:hypothetical protein [Candidatus Saccharibacteria bacterium]
MSLSIRNILFAVPLFCFISIVFTILSPTPAQAVTGGDWRAGNVIDDGVFYNNNDMSVADIQNFLNGKVTCDTWGAKSSEYGGGTRAQYGASRGYPAPYTCLKDYTQDGKTAAQIIKEAADTYRISSKSLIVLLQKEQALVTDEWPWSIQYRSATGYGCPDTAPCDAEYYGFRNQVMKAAYQFRRYATYPSEYRYKPYQNNSIQFNPNSGCGSTNVYIENLATAGLYNYTPYQPNPSALSNLYGTGDSCGAYGNRNFWRLFNDWFGSTRTPNYSAQYIDVANYSDSSKAVSVPANKLNPGQRTFMVLRFRNMGSQSWKNTGHGVIRLSTLDTMISPFCDNSWISCDRPTTMNEASVAPGGVATFEFWYKAPAVTSHTTFLTNFGLVSDPIGRVGGSTQFQTTIVYAPVYSAQYLSVENYTDSSKTTSVPANILSPGQRTYMVLRFRNIGNMSWRNSGSGAVRVLIRDQSSSPFCETTWVSCNRPAEMNEALVSPGQDASFEFWYKAPATSSDTSFLTRFGLVSDPISLIGGTTQSQTTLVKASVYSAQYLSVENYTDSSKTTSVPANILSPGQRTYMVLRFRNTGTINWTSSGSGVIRLLTNNGTSSPFCDQTWLTCNRPTELKGSTVSPGQDASFEFWYKAPMVSSVTTYTTRFSLVSDPISMLQGSGQIQTTNVIP